MANLHHAYRKLRAEFYSPLARLLRRPNRFHYRKVLGGWMRQYGIQNPRLFIPPDLPYEGWLEPESSVSDDFDRTDRSLDADPPGTWTELTGDLGIISNEVGYSSGTTLAQTRYDTALSSGNHWSQIVIPTAAMGNTSICGPICRKDGSATLTMYTSFYRDRSTDDFRTQKRVDGVNTNIGTDTVASASDGDVLRIEANGSTIRRILNTVEQDSVSDTDIDDTSFLYAGIIMARSAAGNPKADDFEAADLVTGGGHHRIGFGAGYSQSSP
ncbi:MAG: hypothetical protein IH908_05375 [Proteobacteria bacterium]|nr:hypothetical protein [Pseudomonadota bacterium]